MSIVAVILALSSTSTAGDELTEAQHTKALEYLALNLAIRDRQEIVRVMCHRNPDHVTAAIRTGVEAYTPMIRYVHQAVNLSDTIWDLERFITDMLAISKPKGKKGEEKPPSVEDYVDLLHRHQDSSHKFLHQVASKGEEVTRWWHEYVDYAASQFKDDADPPNSEAAVSESAKKGAVRKELNAAFESMSAEDQKAVQGEVNAYAQYMDDLHTASAARISAVIKRTQATPYGPGAYLARWQHLLDTTEVTPDKAKGPVRTGHSRSVKEEGRKDIDGKATGFVTEEQAEKVVDEKTPHAPNVEKTLRLLGPKFRAILAGG